MVLDTRDWYWVHPDGRKENLTLEVGDRVRVVDGVCEVVAGFRGVYFLTPIDGEPSPAIRPELSLTYS